MAKASKRETRSREMREVLERWRRSGLPLARFADGEGIGRKTLYRWRLRLGIGGAGLHPGRPKGSLHRRSRKSAESSVKFTEVGSMLRAAASSTARFEVELRDGTTIRVPLGFDPDALEQLVKTLGRC